MSRATPASGFFCGPLQDKALQLANSGRELQGHQEAMLGHQQGWVQITDPEVLAASGKIRHPIPRPGTANSAPLAGTVFRISPEELAAARDPGLGDPGLGRRQRLSF